MSALIAFLFFNTFKSHPSFFKCENKVPVDFRLFNKKKKIESMFAVIL